jgi:hypothetical protein
VKVPTCSIPSAVTRRKRVNPCQPATIATVDRVAGVPTANSESQGAQWVTLNPLYVADRWSQEKFSPVKTDFQGKTDFWHEI